MTSPPSSGNHVTDALRDFLSCECVTERVALDSSVLPKKNPQLNNPNIQEVIMAKHSTRKRGAQARQETLRRREIRRAKYAGTAK